jgi:hypothetical protein
MKRKISNTLRAIHKVWLFALVTCLSIASTPAQENSSLDALALQAANAIFKATERATERPKIVVADFVQQREVAVRPLGVHLADQFSAALAKSARGFDVFDRSQLDDAFAAYKLSTKDLADAAELKCYGLEPSAVVVVSGTIDVLPDHMVIHINALRADQMIFEGAAALPITSETRLQLDEPSLPPAHIDWTNPNRPDENPTNLVAGREGASYPNLRQLPICRVLPRSLPGAASRRRGAVCRNRLRRVL